MTTPDRIAAIDRALAAKVRVNALMGYGLDQLVNLHDFDLVVVNSSGGKDSGISLFPSETRIRSRSWMEVHSS